MGQVFWLGGKKKKKRKRKQRVNVFLLQAPNDGSHTDGHGLAQMKGEFKIMDDLAA